MECRTSPLESLLRFSSQSTVCRVHATLALESPWHIVIGRLHSTFRRDHIPHIERELLESFHMRRFPVCSEATLPDLVCSDLACGL